MPTKSFKPGDVLANIKSEQYICYENIRLSEIGELMSLMQPSWFVPKTLLVVCILPGIQSTGKLSLAYVVTDTLNGWMFLGRCAQRVSGVSKRVR